MKGIINPHRQARIPLRFYNHTLWPVRSYEDAVARATHWAVDEPNVARFEVEAVEHVLQDQPIDAWDVTLIVTWTKKEEVRRGQAS